MARQCEQAAAAAGCYIIQHAFPCKYHFQLRHGSIVIRVAAAKNHSNTLSRMPDILDHH